jgi:hypothetical protein
MSFLLVFNRVYRLQCDTKPNSEPTKFLDHPKQKPRRGVGLRQIPKQLPQSPLTGQFF